MHQRLALLMFLQYAIPGAFVPWFSVWLEHLQFSPMELAWGCATGAMGSLLAPLLAGQAADRWLAAERCIAGCAAVAGGLLWLLAGLRQPLAVFWTSLALWFFLVPVLTLGVSLTFRQLPHPERDFGRVRLWGTIGWILPGGFLSLWFWRSGIADLSDGLRLGGLLAWVLAAYALTLPHTPPLPSAAKTWTGLGQMIEAPMRALGLCRQRSFAVFCACSLGLYITIPFSSQMSPLLLQKLGLARWELPSVLTIAQWTEVVTLALLPMLLLRLQIRGTMLLGLIAWAGSLTIQGIGQPTGLVIGALALNGICISCYLVAGQLYVNRAAQADIRASAQGLLTFLNGAGLLGGHLLVGLVRRLGKEDFAFSFGVGAILAFTLVLVFTAGFRGERGA